MQSQRRHICCNMCISLPYRIRCWHKRDFRIQQVRPAVHTHWLDPVATCTGPAGNTPGWVMSTPATHLRWPASDPHGHTNPPDAHKAAVQFPCHQHTTRWGENRSYIHATEHNKFLFIGKPRAFLLTWSRRSTQATTTTTTR